MSRFVQTMDPGYFEQLYAADIDPWKFATSDYEREKYAQTLASLPRAHYGRALEIGCSIGVLTRQLAARSQSLLALDAAAGALAQAKTRCASQENVEFAQMFVPVDWPPGEFDLILLSEVVYYLDADDVAALAARVSSSLAASGNVVLVHWTGETNYPLTGDAATELFIERIREIADRVHSERRPEYRLDVLIRR